MLSYTSVRHGVVVATGMPIIEEAVYLHDQSGTGHEASWHDEVVAKLVAEDGIERDVPNAWRLVTVTHPMADPAALAADPTAWYPDLPTSADFLILTDEQHAKMAEEYEAKMRERWEAGVAAGLLERQAAYDARAARFRRLGFTKSEVIAEIGTRPEDVIPATFDALAIRG